MMNEYTKIMEFGYNGKIYNYYLDNLNKKFFTGYDSSFNEVYIPIEEYVDLLILFNRNHGISNISDDFGSMFDENYNSNKNYNDIKKKKFKKKRIIPKVISGGILALITPVLISSCISMRNASNSFKEHYDNLNNNISVEQSVDENYKNDVVNSSTSSNYTDIYLAGVPSKFELDTYIDNRDNTNRLYIYDMDYVDKAISFPKKDLNNFIEVINNNPKISEKFKPLAIKYCEDIFKKYPNIELRPFYRNLQNLEVVECTENELLKVSWNIDSRGCYVRDEDKIYVLKDKEYKEKTWDYQVIYHELSHCLRDSIYTDENGVRTSIQFSGLNYYDIPNAEALNSLFAVSLFDYEEKDISYQLQSNTHKLMIECMDNYDLSDYVNHSMTYYAMKLDEYNHDDNYATKILALMNAQYEDYHDDKVEANQSEYYPIYDYVSKMYLGKHLNANMSYDEAKAVMDDFLDKLLFDVPEEYHFDKNHFYEYFNEYCNNLGIYNNTNVK